jgi:PAS domain S-box-containing protein
VLDRRGLPSECEVDGLEVRLAPRQRVEVHAGRLECPDEFDPCLLGQSTFGRYTDVLVEWEERAAPTFLPTLLILDEKEVSTADGRVWKHVDEVVSTPISKVQLQGRMTGLLARRELSKALAERERRMRRILQTIPDPLLIVDETGAVVETNPALRAYVGSESGSLEGTQLSAIEAFPPETVTTLTRLASRDPESESAPDSATAKDGQPREESTITYRSAGGTRRYAEVGVAKLDDQPGTVGQTLFVLRDVTDRRIHERELERERDRLDDFADMLAHEVRNPLNIAQGFLEQITPNDERERDALDRVRASQTRIEQMTKELLTHARGEPIGEIQTVDLAQIAHVAWGQTPTGEATLEVVDENQTIEANPETLQTTLENLFRNAIEHAGPTVTIRIGALPEGGFYVEDDGPGIPDEKKQQVIEEGFTTAEDGTGFGLAIVRDIVRAHGWEIAITDGAEGGARIEITGVSFSWTRDRLTAILGESLGQKKATELVAQAMADLGVDRPQFDRETADALLSAIRDRNEVSSLAVVAAQTAQKQLESD